jgi:hypothetical protein
MRRFVRFVMALLTFGTAASVALAAPLASAATPAKAPPGYVRVFTDPIPIPPSQFDFGAQVFCPDGLVPLGGGVVFSGGFASEGENIESSIPLPTGWEGHYHNSGTRQGDHFAVEAICAQQPPGYTVAFKTVANPAGTQNFAIAHCPGGTKLLSGGSQTTGDTIDLQLLSAWPMDNHRYKAVMLNASSRNEQLTAFAVCAQKPPRYTITTSSFTDEDGGPVTDVGGAQCPAHTKIIGGGIHVAAARPTVTLGGSVGEPDMQWLAEVVNLDPNAVTVTIYAICAS